MRSMRMDHPLERSQEFPVFFFQTDGYSNHTSLDVTNDDTLPEHGLKQRAAVSPDIDKDKIRLARDRRKAKCGQALDHLLHPSLIHRSTPRHMFVITEGSERCALRQAIGVKGRTDSVQEIGDLRCRHAVSDPQSSEAIDF